MPNKPIFHITHVDNLPSIIGARCLWSDAPPLVRQRQYPYINVSGACAAITRYSNQNTLKTRPLVNESQPPKAAVSRVFYSCSPSETPPPRSAQKGPALTYVFASFEEDIEVIREGGKAKTSPQ
ncbi:hypothetical protein MNBD_GAMMA07-1888 [hydrothermal vent metagenome]|uniref:DarT domain-containing protein n=1 Tax=hydrothermal vent metagenome TaxID=652676 RepID=A0A3B0XI08_9ZZZZ